MTLVIICALMIKLLLLVLISFPTFAKITLIADFDDTIKISHSSKVIQATARLFSKRVFGGMADFIQTTQSYTDELHVVSAGPRFIKTNVSWILRKYNITPTALHMRRIPGHESKKEFKLRKITEIIEATDNDIILVGDDVDLDPEVYSEIKMLYPYRILASYIHVIKRREIPNGLTAYWTTFDLVLMENLAGRINDSITSKLIEKFLRLSDLNLVIPSFADCPTSPLVWDWQLHTPYSRQSQTFTKKLNLLCEKRHKITSKI